MKSVRSALVLFTAALALAVGTQPTWAQSLFTGENLLITIPKDEWKVGFSNKRPGYVIVEYVAPNETVDDWTRMLTVQVYQNNPMTIDQFSAGMRNTVDTQPCDRTALMPGGSGKVNGYDSSQLILMCTRHKQTGKGEFTLMRLIRGADSFYIVQRAWRGVSYTPDAIPVEEADYKQWVAFMSKVSLCDTRATEHPCPTMKSGAK